jgi:hypothetical protein
MGLMDLLFGSGKSRIDKLTERITNRRAVDRYGAMENLLELGAQTWEAENLPDGSPERAALERESEDAYIALLRRFTMNAKNSIDDEEEKIWLYGRLSKIGKPMLAPIKRFCLETKAASPGHCASSRTSPTSAKSGTSSTHCWSCTRRPPSTTRARSCRC